MKETILTVASLQLFGEEAPPQEEIPQEEAPQKEGAALYDAWLAQAEETRELYPGFDLSAEMGNPKFLDLLSARVDVRTAYEVLHKEELIPSLMAYTAQEVERRLMGKLAAGALRPQENGSGSQGAALSRVDVSRMSKKDRQEVIRRVQRGERVVF